MKNTIDVVECTYCKYYGALEQECIKPSQYLIDCPRCGYHDSRYIREIGVSGICREEPILIVPYGVVSYRMINERSLNFGGVASTGEMIAMEEWLRGHIEDLVVDEESASLGRWNPESRKMEMVIGKEFSWANYEKVLAQVLGKRWRTRLLGRNALFPPPA